MLLQIIGALEHAFDTIPCEKPEKTISWEIKIREIFIRVKFRLQHAKRRIGHIRWW